MEHRQQHRVEKGRVVRHHQHAIAGGLEVLQPVHLHSIQDREQQPKQ
jgi:hypothetical protein